MIKNIGIYRDGFRIERLHTIPHSIPYSNGHHSANAAMIGYELCKKNNYRTENVVLALLVHDIHEQHTGDIPAPTKRYSDKLKTELTRMEQDWESDNNIPNPPLSAVEIDIVKASDTIELGLHCLDELQMGNRMLLSCLKNVIAYLEPYIDRLYGIKSIIDIFIKIHQKNYKELTGIKLEISNYV